MQTQYDEITVKQMRDSAPATFMLSPVAPDLTAPAGGAWLWERYRDQTDERALWKAYERAESFVEAQLILHRIAQLQDYHPVDGMLEERELRALEREIRAIRTALAPKRGYRQQASIPQVTGRQRTELQRRLQRLKQRHLAHQSGLEAARAKAERARRLQPAFEPQDLGEIEDWSKRHPKQLRAVFLERSLLRDHLAYVEYTRPREPHTVFCASWIWDSLSRRVGFVHSLAGSAPPQSVCVAELWEALQAPVQSKLPVLTAQDLHHHFHRYAPSFSAALSPSQWEELERRVLLEGLLGQPEAQIRWREAAEPRFRLIAEVDPGDAEERVVRALLRAGATVEEHHLEVPTYQSWAEVKPGKRFVVDDQDGRRILYVPHRSVATTYRLTYHHQVELKLWEPDRALELSHAIRSYWKDHALSALPQAEAAHYREVEGVGWLQHHHAAAASKELEGLRLLLQRKTPIRVTFTTSAPQTPRPIPDRAIRRAACASPGSAAEEEERLRHIDANNNYLHLKDRLRKQLKRQKLPGALKRALLRLAEVDALEPLIAHRSFPRLARAYLPHDAPASDRGCLMLDGYRPAEAVRRLTELGLAGGVVSSVPYELIYANPHNRAGRITPKLGLYQAGKAALTLPQGHMVLHGITGVGDPEAALRRLEMIGESGGVEAICERRRLGLQVETLSPLGDIASGLDMGVPCKIGSVPSYGAFIFLGLKPEVLERRDVWFAHRDFGGGHDRFEEYKRYAQRIRQGHPYRPPSHKARVRHLERGLYRHDNEVWFRHRINLEEIDTIFCTASLADRVRELAQRWHRQGLTSRLIEVVPYTYAMGHLIHKRAAQLRAQRRDPAHYRAA